MKEIFQIKKTFSIRTIISSMWIVFKKEWKVLVSATVVYLVVAILTGGDPEKISQSQKILGLLINILLLYLLLGALRITLRMIRGETYGWNTFKISARDLFSVVMTVILYSVIPVAVLFLVGLGIENQLFSYHALSGRIIISVVLSIIGILYLIYFMRFGMWIYFVLDRNYKPVDALKASYRATKGSTLRLLGFLFLSVVSMMVGTILLGIGILIIIPLYFLCSGAIYERLSKHMLGESSEFPVEQPKELETPIGVETDPEIKTHPLRES